MPLMLAGALAQGDWKADSQKAAATAAANRPVSPAPAARRPGTAEPKSNRKAESYTMLVTGPSRGGLAGLSLAVNSKQAPASDTDDDALSSSALFLPSDAAVGASRRRPGTAIPSRRRLNRPASATTRHSWNRKSPIKVAKHAVDSPTAADLLRSDAVVGEARVSSYARQRDTTVLRPDSETAVHWMEERDPVHKGLAETWGGRWESSQGFQSLVWSIDKVLPDIEEESLGEKWRALGEWVCKFHNDRDAHVVAARCVSLLRMNAETGEKEGRPSTSAALGLGLKSAINAVALAKRMRISSRRREVAAACVALDQLLIFVAKGHTALWPVVRKARHLILGLTFGVTEGRTIDFDGCEADWNDSEDEGEDANPAALAPVPDFARHEDQATVQRALNMYARRRSWYELAQDQRRQLGSMKLDVAQTRESNKKLLSVMDRGMRFWQSVVRSVLLRAWRALRRADKRASADAAKKAAEWRGSQQKDQQVAQSALERARREVQETVTHKYRLQMREIEKKLEEAEGASRESTEKRTLLEKEVEVARERISCLETSLEEQRGKVTQLEEELDRFRELCKDFIKTSLEGEDWIVSRQEELKEIAEVGLELPPDSPLPREGTLSPKNMKQALQSDSPVGADSFTTPYRFPADESPVGLRPQPPQAVKGTSDPMSPLSGISDVNYLRSELATGDMPVIGQTPASPRGWFVPSKSKRRKKAPLPFSPKKEKDPTPPFPLRNESFPSSPVLNMTREELAQFCSSREDEAFVVRWFNACLVQSGIPDATNYRVQNFTKGNKLLVPYAIVMHYMSPGAVSALQVQQIIASTRDVDKAEKVLAAAESIDMFFPLTARELVNPMAREQHVLIATALFQRFCDPHLAYACGMRPLQRPDGLGPIPSPLWPDGRDPVTADEWRARMHQGWVRSMRWRGAGAAAQSLATEVLLSRVQGRSDKEQSMVEVAQMRQYVTVPLEPGSGIDDILVHSDPAATEVAGVEDVLNEHYGDLRRIYLYYSTGDHLDTELSLDEAMRLLHDSRLMHPKGPVSRQMIESAFAKVSRRGQSTLDPSEFVALLIRLCGDVKKHWVRGTVGSRFRTLIEDCVLPHANYVDLTEFRHTLYGDSCTTVVEQYNDLLVSTFKAFASQGGREKTMSIRDFQDMVQSMQIVDTVLTHDAVRAIFVKMQDTDSENLHQQIRTSALGAGFCLVPAEHTATFREFIECVAALAMFKIPAPYLPLCRRLARFFELFFAPSFSDGRLLKLRSTKQRSFSVAPVPRRKSVVIARPDPHAA